MDDVREQLGANVRRHRQRLALTQEELAKDSGLDRSEVGLVERGEYYARLDTLVKLARGLQLDSPSKLLEGIIGFSADAPGDGSADA